ncbi:helix-turn-helix domain-containing protein [Rhizobium miluonense]|uniref:AraC-type DNA-binding protein n=1 Tax=Rhizobium miluonense TaxID=411945 RepID=A0A1C3WFW1_9HYPH|nr:AraC family transcriptional regulator [Rhizobium miluonense]SCB38903.1 AraC-type DNA-binding protein [Rhizobium miluonense]
MPLIPLSFVVALLLLVLFVTVLRAGNDNNSRSLPFLALILLSSFQAFLSGLRWGYGILEVMYIAPVGAALVPPLVYCGVAKLVRKNGSSRRLSLGLHAIPAIAIAMVLLMAEWRGAVDVLLPAIFIGYAGAILHLMRSGPDALRRTPFESAAPVYRALVFAALALLLSATLDLFVFLDFSWTQGRHAPVMVTIGNLILLIILSIAAAVAVQGSEPTEVETVTPNIDDVGDKETLAAIQMLMETKRSYRDPDLNLDRLARKAIIPARQISTAINRATGKNVSQYVNEFRVAEACRLLTETERSVTEVMLEVGFQTKSNFNREFRRVTDMTPVEWRQSRAKRA